MKQWIKELKRYVKNKQILNYYKEEIINLNINSYDQIINEIGSPIEIAQTELGDKYNKRAKRVKSKLYWIPLLLTLMFFAAWIMSFVFNMNQFINLIFKMTSKTQQYFEYGKNLVALNMSKSAGKFQVYLCLYLFSTLILDLLSIALMGKIIYNILNRLYGVKIKFIDNINLMMLILLNILFSITTTSINPEVASMYIKFEPVHNTTFSNEFTTNDITSLDFNNSNIEIVNGTKNTISSNQPLSTEKSLHSLSTSLPIFGYHFSTIDEITANIKITITKNTKLKLMGENNSIKLRNITNNINANKLENSDIKFEKSNIDHVQFLSNSINDVLLNNTHINKLHMNNFVEMKKINSQVKEQSINNY